MSLCFSFVSRKIKTSPIILARGQAEFGADMSKTMGSTVHNKTIEEDSPQITYGWQLVPFKLRSFYQARALCRRKHK